jgi:aromatic ring-opening dioxygenase catalytic subunit (LigB family)
MKENSMDDKKLPTLFIPHGGGPCFFMDWPGDPHMWDQMADFLRDVNDTLPARPKAILIISGHWEEDEFTVGSNPQPSLIYDYQGFPAHTYALTYPASGAPELATRVHDLLAAAGLPARIDTQRGWDHGVFIPLKVMYPDADVPVLQLSMKKGLDPALHLRAGQALQSLREEGVLIIGSGMSFHNMRGFSPAFREASQEFDDWLAHMATQDEAVRNALLQNWEQAPNARQVQPHPDHLLPLMVAAGAAGADQGKRIFEDTVMNVVVSAIAFGEIAET